MKSGQLGFKAASPGKLADLLQLQGDDITLIIQHKRQFPPSLSQDAHPFRIGDTARYRPRQGPGIPCATSSPVSPGTTSSRAPQMLVAITGFAVIMASIIVCGMPSRYDGRQKRSMPGDVRALPGQEQSCAKRRSGAPKLRLDAVGMIAGQALAN